MKWYAACDAIPISIAKEIVPLGMILSPVNPYRKKVMELIQSAPPFYQKWL